MNPIRPEDLFAPEFTGGIDKIVESLKSAVQTLTNEIDKVKKAASTLASTPIATNQAESTRKWAESVGTLNAQYKALLKDYGLIYNELSEVTTVQRDQNQILKIQQQYTEAAEGSFNKLSAEYRLLKIAANALDPSIKENARNFKYMQDRMAELYSAMNKYQQSTGKFSMQVGDYSKALNGLNLSTQQILREMPTLANSTSQFFMAISNNVPIFIDNFKRARQELGSFSAALTGTLRALLSWQTLLLVVLTILPKLAKAIHDKKKAQEEENKKMAEQIDHLKQIHSAMVAVAQAEATSVIKVNLLVGAINDLNRANSERIEAAEILKGLFKEQLQNYSAEEIALGKAQVAIDNITASLKTQAKARAIINKLTEAYNAQIEAEDRMMTAGATRIKGAPAGMVTVAALSRYMKEAGLSDREAKKLLSGVNDEVIELVHNYDQAKKEVKEYGTTIEDLSKKVDLATLADNKTGGGGGEKELKLGQIPDYVVAFYEAVIAGMEEGDERIIIERSKNLIKAEKAYAADYAELAEKEKIAIAKGNVEAIAEIHRQMRIRQRAYEEEIANLPIAAEIKIEEFDYSTIVKDIEEETGLQILDPLKKVRRAYVEAMDAMRGYTSRIQQGLDEGRKIGDEELRGWQEVIKKKILAEAEYQKAKKRLELQGRRDALQISQAEYEDLLKIEYGKIDSAARKSIDKIGKKREKRWNIWVALFGTDRKDETTGTITRELGEDVKYALDQTMNAYKTATKYIDEYIDALSRAAQQAIETANTEVDMARKVYETELEARANGYANAVDTARMEYEQRLQMQKKAQAESEKIQKTQLAMESASQAASLLTATANILASYSKLPLIGQALAIAGIATMWTTFLAAKAKAGQVTKYGEGMSEYLDYGGSHASGHDIDFGMTPDGRRRRVERGEVIGVINKRNVRRYGASTVTGIIDSLNKGNFEYKYGNAFTPAIVAGGKGTDLHKLESGVDALVRQGEYREMRDGDKRIIQYKNLTRTIR